MEDILRHGQLSALAALLVFSSSCSWYRNLERSLVEDDEKNQKRSRTVSREQYDQLLVKYEELSKKYEELKENPNAGKSSLVNELQQGENFAQGVSQSETVDVFAGQGSQGAATAAPTALEPGDLEGQINLYRRAVSLKGSNPGEATKLFQQLENDGLPAVKARAKLQIGELLFEKGQYDLALQVFDDIITRHAHSGVVLEALKFAAVCADKLKTPNKKDQYASMLSDVFESN